MPGMEMLLGWRDRLLADSGFQRWSARFPLTRLVARREARALFDICAGFTYSQVLTACLELDLFARVAARPVRLESLALLCAVPEPAMRMLIDAAVSLRLLRVRKDGVRLGALGAALRGNPGIAAMVAHHRLFYADISDPVALLRGQIETRLASFWPYQTGAGEAAAYSALMAATQPMIANEILDAYDVSRHKVILDIGGGDGSFLRQVARKAPRRPAAAVRSPRGCGCGGAEFWAGRVAVPRARVRRRFRQRPAAGRRRSRDTRAGFA